MAIFIFVLGRSILRSKKEHMNEMNRSIISYLVAY